MQLNELRHKFMAYLCNYAEYILEKWLRLIEFEIKID